MNFTPLAACTYETRITNIDKAQKTNKPAKLRLRAFSEKTKDHARSAYKYEEAGKDVHTTRSSAKELVQIKKDEEANPTPTPTHG